MIVAIWQNGKNCCYNPRVRPWDLTTYHRANNSLLSKPVRLWHFTSTYLLRVSLAYYERPGQSSVIFQPTEENQTDNNKCLCKEPSPQNSDIPRGFSSGIWLGVVPGISWCCLLLLIILLVQWRLTTSREIRLPTSRTLNWVRISEIDVLEMICSIVTYYWWATAYMEDCLKRLKWAS